MSDHYNPRDYADVQREATNRQFARFYLMGDALTARRKALVLPDPTRINRDRLFPTVEPLPAAAPPTAPPAAPAAAPAAAPFLPLPLPRADANDANDATLIAVLAVVVLVVLVR